MLYSIILYYIVLYYALVYCAERYLRVGPDLDLTSNRFVHPQERLFSKVLCPEDSENVWLHQSLFHNCAAKPSPGLILGFYQCHVGVPPTKHEIFDARVDLGKMGATVDSNI